MKPIVFKFKHEPAEHAENQEWKNYSVKEFPKSANWVHFAGFAILAVGIGLGYWAGHPGLGILAGGVACCVFVVTAHPRRCPQCRGSVITRVVEEENGFKRFFHDCPICRISWRCEERHWDSTDD